MQGTGATAVNKRPELALTELIILTGKANSVSGGVCSLVEITKEYSP